MRCRTRAAISAVRATWRLPFSSWTVNSSSTPTARQLTEPEWMSSARDGPTYSA
ncbi:hypothetical protein [Streptomyces sp. NEAU-L66]|uniref:hypothetical protein n=1 Tax=Streptomyces sp. NEAU-L66 TaxID=3390812 RepID=UPI0039C6BC4E